MPATKTMPVQPECLRAGFQGKPLAVDRENGILRGYVLAQEGVFKDRRGEFNAESLKQIVRMVNASRNGLKARWTHPTASSDSAGNHLGRSKGAVMGTTVDERTGKAVAAARADLHFHPTAFQIKVPNSDISRADYIFNLAESDAGAISSSLVIKPREEFKKDDKGRMLTDESGEPLPPLWFPEELRASDIVGEGAAVDALLSPEDLCQALSVGLTDDLRKLLRFDNVARLATQLLDGLFDGQDRGVVEARCRGWLDSYLALRFGDECEGPVETPKLDALAARLERMRLTTKELKG